MYLLQIAPSITYNVVMVLIEEIVLGMLPETLGLSVIDLAAKLSLMPSLICGLRVTYKLCRRWKFPTAEGIVPTAFWALPMVLRRGEKLI